MALYCSEAPIFVARLNEGTVHEWAGSEVPVERAATATLDAWVSLTDIPAVPPPMAPWPGGPVVSDVQGVSDVPLGANPADPLQYAYQFSAGAAPPLDRFAQMVPAAQSGGAYTPTLRDTNGRTIPYDPGVWVADGLLQVVQFCPNGPAELGYAPPLTLSYWRYVGLTAGPGVDNLANEGGGAEVYDEATLATLRTLVGTANGIAVTQQASTIEVDNTLTGANLGAGTGTIFAAKSGAALQFNSLAGTANGLTVSAPAAGVVTVDNTLTGANLGAGVGLFAAKSGAALQFNSLAGTANGLTVSAPAAGVITIDNTLTGANLGAGTGTLFAAKSGAALQFNSLAGTANGLTVSAPAAGVITINNTLTGANLGAGTGLFAAKSGATLQFNSLVAGSGISLGLAAGSITAALTTTGVAAGTYGSLNAAPQITVGTDGRVTSAQNNALPTASYAQASYPNTIGLGTNITLTSSFVELTDISAALVWSLGPNSADFSMPTDGRFRYTGSTTRRFLVSAYAYFLHTTSTPVTYWMEVRVNGAQVTGGRSVGAVSNNSLSPGTMTAIVSLAQNQYVSIFLGTSGSITVNLRGGLCTVVSMTG